MTEKELQSVISYVIPIRRKLHENPELSYQEIETTKTIATELEEMGIEVQVWDDITGVVGLLRYSDDAPTIGLRADIDALPIQEETGLLFSSKNPGVMHACGHDGHTAVLLGIAKILSEREEKLKANVKFIFQPAEEVPPGGAVKLIEKGALENPKVDILWSCHSTTSLPVGKIGIHYGPFMASADMFKLTVKCQGGHGATPYQGSDGIAVAAQIITAIQYMVTRQISQLTPTVVSIGAIHGGNRSNILANEVEMLGTCRTLDAKMRDELPGRIRTLAENIAANYNATIELDYEYGYPVVINNNNALKLIQAGAEEALGAENVVEIPQNMSGDDLAYFLQKVPGAYFFFGTEDPKVARTAHTPTFILDEDSIPVAMKVILSTMEKYVAEQP